MASATITCGIFLYSRPAGKFLVCHATNARWTQWSIPKGILENGEEQFAAACRELLEETGIDLKEISDKKIFPLPMSKYKKQNKELRSFLIIVNEDFQKHSFKSALVAGKNFSEVDSWKWITLDEGVKWIHESQATLLSSIRELAQPA